MWLERFNIVVISLRARTCPRPGAAMRRRSGTGSCLAARVGLFLTGLLLAVRLVPIVSMYEMRELLAEDREQA